jgi:LysM domain
VPEDSVAGTRVPPDSAQPPARSNRTVTPAVAGALVVLAASFALSVGFVLANGGLDLPAAAHPTATASALAADVPAATGSDNVAPTTAPSAIVSPGPTSTPPPATPAPSVAPTPGPTSAPTPNSSSNRYALLSACPESLDCWVYVVREGDNLVSIARYFGVPLSVVQEHNPWTRSTQLVAGQKLLLPPPTR